ncbi:hypothetical protein EDB92DRAFT_1867478 [Lactarius akahatsu]|uniref:CCHC-type domain-containing protein n=1 Tax=Lactarius akahatsu TaxID=416441 RepID=A0AAD4LIH2_9AGAM|nr:hypothetical protein EDB92DRAFT_1867478 [Lactarius akahatsu]
MAYNVSKKGCFKCGNLGHIAENCTSQDRLCYNCRKPGHESSACPEPRTVAAKQCYSCGGIGHIQAECPTLRLQGSNQKCYNCGHFGHIARVCPNDAADYGFAPRAPPPGRGLNVASLPPVKDCLAPPYAVTEDMNGAKLPVKTCYRCKKDWPRREPVEEEDTAWGEVQEDDPWGNVALPADGANAVH